MRKASLLLLGFWLLLTSCSAPVDSISGRVLNEEGDILPAAIVRVQTTTHHTTADQDGYFTLKDLPAQEAFFITAWTEGYFINGVAEVKAGQEIEIVLHKHHDTDNHEYEWLASSKTEGEGEDQGCQECHSNEGLTFSLPYEEWLQDTHSQSALNPRFLTMYTGQDIDGNQSPLTRFEYSRDYGKFALPHDPNQPYYGPGYMLDFPSTQGNCGACHTPLTAINAPYSVNPSLLSGVELEGISCDFCHKVWDVKLDENEMPYDNMPGVLSYEFRRPPEGHQFFAGPFDDVAPGEDTYTPIQQESAYCAPCHFSIFWDVTIYNSYGEWLASPYSDPQNGQTCQDCHMPPGLSTHFARPDQGGLERDPQTIFSHKMLGITDEEFMRDALKVSTSVKRDGETVFVEVTLDNDNTGHHIPTDSPLRQLILIVNALDSEDQKLELAAGPILPDWTGIGDPADGYYAGLPGTAYAKILKELWTEITPSGSYWNPTQIVSDNRIAAMGSSTTAYSFKTPEGDAVDIEIKVIYRRAFITLTEQKKWDTPDMLIYEESVILD